VRALEIPLVLAVGTAYDQPHDGFGSD